MYERCNLLDIKLGDILLRIVENPKDAREFWGLEGAGNDVFPGKVKAARSVAQSYC